MVRLHGTFSTYIYTGETSFAGCLCTCSRWFKSIEPPRTFSNHIMTEIAGRVEFIHMSSGWFDCTEPSLTTSLQGKQSVQGARALVRGGSSASNLLEPHHRRDSKVCRVLFRTRCGLQSYSRTTPNSCHRWFDCNPAHLVSPVNEPSLSTLLQGKQGVQCAYALVRGGDQAH